MLEKQEVVCSTNLRPETEQTFNYSDSAAIGQATYCCNTNSLPVESWELESRTEVKHMLNEI